MYTIATSIEVGLAIYDSINNGEQLILIARFDPNKFSEDQVKGICDILNLMNCWDQNVGIKVVDDWEPRHRAGIKIDERWLIPFRLEKCNQRHQQQPI